VTDLRIPPGSDPSGLDRQDPFAFTFEGAEVAAHPGETIATALLAQGIRTLRATRAGGRPRGLFCAIGACFDCLVTVDDAGPLRACLTPAAPGVRVEGHRVD
jgi:ferredoxin